MRKLASAAVATVLAGMMAIPAAPASAQSVSVSVGQQVAPGDVIGATGSTGNVTGPHLHLEVRPGADDPVDPATWLKRRAVRV